jgi:hypothetical protein
LGACASGAKHVGLTDTGCDAGRNIRVNGVPADQRSLLMKSIHQLEHDYCD